MKLWEKTTQIDKEIERFTVGRDREMDLYLAPYDVLGSMAHITMLESIGLRTADELAVLLQELKKIYELAVKGDFVIEEGIEDVHSQVELMLTRALGDIGKKIHSGRSRNDQVLVDLKLFTRDQIKELVGLTKQLFDTLVEQSERYKDVLMPGYTHLQIAMPSSFGLWLGAYAESLVDDMTMLQAAYRTVNRNPLGSAAGYGSSFPLNRTMTTRLLGFDSMDYNVIYAQMGRGKMERNVSYALASLAGTIAMQALPQQIVLISNNLPSGYFRDYQILKEVFLPAFEEMKDCLKMTTYIISRLSVNTHILDDPRYQPIFTVERVNELVLQGVPFRDAYKQVGIEFEQGKFQHSQEVHHTHEGSIGRLCNAEISDLMQHELDKFGFAKVAEAEHQLLAGIKSC